MFVPFSVFYMRQPLELAFLWAGRCLMGAVYFMFRGQAHAVGLAAVATARHILQLMINLPLRRYAPLLIAAAVGISTPFLLPRQLPDSIDFTAPPGSGKPFLTKTANGDFLLSWLEPRPNHAAALRFARRSGSAWSKPRTIVEGKNVFVNWADFPSIVESGDRLFAHWLEKTVAKPYAYHIRVAVSSTGGKTWSPPKTLHSDLSPTEHGFVALLPDSDGTVSAAWLDGRQQAATPPGPMTLRFATIRPDGKVTGETSLDEMTCDCCQVAMARTDSGRIVAYRNRTEDEVRDIAFVREVGGKWTEPAIVANDGWTIKACPVNGPSIAAQGQQVAIAWFTGAGEKPHVKVALSADGGATFRPPTIVDAGHPLGRVQVVMLLKSVAVIWLEVDDGFADWRMRQVFPDGKWGPVSSFSTTSRARASGFSRAVVGGAFMFLAATQTSGDSTDTRARVYRLPLVRVARP